MLCIVYTYVDAVTMCVYVCTVFYCTYVLCIYFTVGIVCAVHTVLFYFYSILLYVLYILFCLYCMCCIYCSFLHVQYSTVCTLYVVCHSVCVVQYVHSCVLHCREMPYCCSQ